MIDVNAMRDLAIQFNGLQRADECYTLYYDETNNIRKLHMRPEGLNVRQLECFVLGGIGHAGPAISFDVEGLRSSLRIQENANEIKLKHLGKGSFLDLLKSRKISTFLDWVESEGLFVHFQVFDVMYWSIVDIIDSIVTELDQPMLMAMSPNLKNDLYSALRNDLDHTVSILNAHDYPDVGRGRRHAFIGELMSLVAAHREQMEPFGYQMLKGVLEMSKTITSLPYLENEEPRVLVDGFSDFYINRICLFKFSSHVLDVEELVQDRLSRQQFVDAGAPFKNYQFVDSTEHVGIQVADVVVGLLGKAFTYVNRTEVGDIVSDRSTMNDIQKTNLSRLSELIDRSIAENAAFAQYIISGTDQVRAQNLFS
ncbi:DUF3800 domain-containing protein [Loktanella sp. F6476L]|uniref:DUF3800 domain-containing protein n=1 Tax=Loktanella sp. F6476L TaxID=2926405 RepID=UPI001FF10A3E|nr:DUF3800 domain-containing protein [Loktanella sp. F6476L]MCK0122558.1 DUF3800 domain-containing protein [Loktanella sp. F6476L]